MADQVKFGQKLRNQKALIIGGSSGIGYGVTEGLIENGAEVIISSSNPSRVEDAVSALKKSYPSAVNRISGHACNLGSEETAEANIQQLFEKAGKLDHIIFTAADSLAMIPVGEIDIGKVQKAGLLRFFAPLLVAKYAPQYLNPGPRSSITLTTGSVSERPLPQWTVIGSYATAIQGMTRGLALDLKPIRVNCVAPGVVDTNLWTDEQRAAVFPRFEATLPTGKVGQVVDVAEAYLYLAKDSNITGSMISTNGGALLV